MISLPKSFSVPHTLEEAAARLAAHPPKRLRSDDRTAWKLQNGDALKEPPPPENLIDAAVFVPLIQKKDGLSVVLTRRAAHLHHHGGQISFPGGRRDRDEETAIETALRETREEIGVPSERMSVLGRLDDYITITGYHVRPIVGAINPPVRYVTDQMEVAEVFDAPLEFLLNPDNLRMDYRVSPEGAKRHFYAIPYGDYYIWGATAAMLVNLSEIMAGP